MTTPAFPAHCLRILAGLPLLAALAAAAPDEPGRGKPEPAAAQAPAENATVKVFATARYPNIPQPWTKLPPREVSGSGVVIEGRRILTNAHVVLYAAQVQVQASQAGEKLSASVEFVAPGIDLAVLKLEDESFFNSHPPLARASVLPAVKDAVMVYGYPTGGTSLSITKGIVSRIEFTGYRYDVSGLRIQIDAAINPGNSGGPAVVGDKMIGLAFSRLGGGAENIGYIVPCEEIDLFLQDIGDGHYDGKPALFDDTQPLQNPALRAWLKIEPAVHGVVVHEPLSDDPAYPLKEWDVITRIGEAPVDDEGMITAGDDLRLAFTYLVQRIARQEKLPLTVVRAGQSRAIELPVLRRRPRLLPHLQGAYPSYFIYGPMVFTNATDDIVAAMAANQRGPAAIAMLSIAGSPLVTRRSDPPAFPGEELVLVPAAFFPHKLAKGYSVPAGRTVSSVNGIAIRNLRHLVEVLRDARDDFITIEFGGHHCESVVLPRREAVAATEEILADNGVRSQGSADTLGIWNAKP